MAKRQQYVPRQQQMYQRPTKAYQQNMMKGMADMTPPEMPDAKKARILHIIVAIVLTVMLLLLVTNVAWWTFIIPILLGLCYLIFFSRYMNGKQKELLKFYQKNRMTREMFIKQIKRSNPDMKPTTIETYIRMWDIVAGTYKGKIKFIDRLFGM